MWQGTDNANADANANANPTPNSVVLTSLSVNGPSTLAPGATGAFTATGRMSDGSTQDYTTKTTWQSSDTSVLTISNTGVATGLAGGEAYVNASAGSTRVFYVSSNVLVLPTGTFRLTGTVSESGLPVVAATVAVTAGQGNGLSVLTSQSGQYRLYGVAGNVDVQVSKPGYTSVTKNINVASNSLLDFKDLVQSGPLATVSGTYTLTLTASASCTGFNALPELAKRRSYTAVITQSGPVLQVTLSGADFQLLAGQGNGFAGRVQPDGVRFEIFGDYYYYSEFDVLEKVQADQVLSFWGEVTATASPAGISGTLDGAITVYKFTPPSAFLYQSGCYASTHQFVLIPQTALARHRK